MFINHCHFKNSSPDFQAAVSGTLEPKATNDSSEDDDLLSGLASNMHHSDLSSSLKMENKYLSSVDSDSGRAIKKSSLHPNKKIRHK